MREPEFPKATVHRREVELSQGVMQCLDQGSGAPIVFIHGLLVNGSVWDRLVAALSPGARCIVPELPLGSHRIPMAERADLTPTGVARMVAELIERLELDDVTLVGNDTGGALSQLVAAHDRERVGRLVLTNCDSFEHFPPPRLRLAISALKLPGLVASLGQLGRLRPVRSTFSIMKLTTQPISDELVRSWLAPLRDRRIRSDLDRFVRAIPATDMVGAGELLRTFDRPALIAWGAKDPYFPYADAERLAATLPDSRLHRLDDASTFVQLDAPERLAELIGELSGSTAPAPQAAR
jgi:pimeloyl-ACP methyl ester carboxylesterase